MNPSVIGIKELFIWNKVQYFNIYSNYSSDILHDVKLELLKYGMGHIIYEYIIKRKTFCFEHQYVNMKFTNRWP